MILLVQGNTAHCRAELLLFTHNVPLNLTTCISGQEIPVNTIAQINCISVIGNV